MKSKLITVFAVLLSATLGFSSLDQACANITQITTNSYEDSLPQIKGNYLVWQGRVDGDWEIFVYDVAEGTTTQITDNDYGDISPQTDGNYVVWLGFSWSGGEIFLYDILNKTTSQITDDSAVELPYYPNVDASPQIANGRVAWTSCEVMDSVEPGEIFLYDIATKTKTSHSAPVDPDGARDDGSPRINDESVMWVQTDDTGNTTVFIHYFDSGTEPAPEGYVWPDSPQTDSGLTVLTRYDGSDREISVYNSYARSYEQITDNELEDRDPCISGNYVAWMAGEAEASEIYVAEYTTPGNGDDDEGLCFIATAAFGSYVDPHVQVLRDFRDECLLTNMPGRWFVNIYNTYGPYWADLLNAHPGCKPFVRLALMPLVGISYFLVKASLAFKLLTGFLLLGFIPICLRLPRR